MKLQFLLITLFISTLCNAQVDLSQGLLAYYPFSGNANDASGNNNNPSFNNATLTSDRHSNANSAYHFDGNSTYMQIPNSATLNPGTKMSVCAWVRVTGFYRGICHGNRILMKGDGDYLSGSYNLCFDDNYYTNGINCSTSTVDTLHQLFRGITSSTTPYPYVNKNQWHSIVYSFDGAKGRFYQDCQLVDSNVVNPSSFTNNFDVFFGKLNSDVFPYWLNGDLDEVRLYNRALNLDEIKLYGDCIVAPVIINKYTAVVNTNNSVTLNWNISQEIDIKNYTIERSTNNVSQFTPIGNIDALNNSTSTNYSFQDNNLSANINYYYRLVINEKDGTRKYSETKKIAIGNQGLHINIYPILSKGDFTVSFNQKTEEINIVVLNNIGQHISTPIIKEAGSINLNLKNQPKGTYWIKIYTTKECVTKKVIIL